MIPMIAVTATTTVPIIIRQSGRDVAGMKNDRQQEYGNLNTMKD